MLLYRITSINPSLPMLVLGSIGPLAQNLLIVHGSTKLLPPRGLLSTLNLNFRNLLNPSLSRAKIPSIIFASSLPLAYHFSTIIGRRTLPTHHNCSELCLRTFHCILPPLPPCRHSVPFSFRGSEISDKKRYWTSSTHSNWEQILLPLFYHAQEEWWAATYYWLERSEPVHDLLKVPHDHTSVNFTINSGKGLDGHRRPPRHFHISIRLS